MRRTVVLVATLASALVLSEVGCSLPRVYRQQADSVAYDIITKKQAESLGRTEPFTVEPPAETLRRRLLLDPSKNLPFAGKASLGTRELEPIKQWPEDGYLKESGDGEDMLAASYATSQSLQLALVDALQIAAHESRDYQTRKEQVFQSALQLDLERNSFRRIWSGTQEEDFMFKIQGFKQLFCASMQGHFDDIRRITHR